MSSALWPIEPHTLAKHEILKNYLKAWFPILSRFSGRIVYLDGFAGPGVYAGGEDGSPVIALQIAVDHTLRDRFKEIVFFFVEKDPNRAKILAQVLKERFPDLPKNMKYEVRGAEFAPTLEQVLDDLEEREARLAPTFAFLDPFGFSGFPLELIGRLMSHDKCEVLITFMAGFVKRFLDEYRAPVLNDLFASQDWKKARSVSNRDRFLLDLYEKQLKNVGGAKYVRSFGMIGPYNQLIYYLVYGTKHWKGLEVMKRAMYKVDRRETYTFSDLTDINQAYLIDYAAAPYWIPRVAEMVYNRFRGMTVTESEVHQFVITNTPVIYQKSILQHLERASPPKITKVTDRTRKLSYPKGCSITFCQ